MDHLLMMEVIGRLQGIFVGPNMIGFLDFYITQFYQALSQYFLLWLLPCWVLPDPTLYPSCIVLLPTHTLQLGSIR